MHIGCWYTLECQAMWICSQSPSMALENFNEVQWVWTMLFKVLMVKWLFEALLRWSPPTQLESQAECAWCSNPPITFLLLDSDAFHTSNEQCLQQGASFTYVGIPQNLEPWWYRVLNQVRSLNGVKQLPSATSSMANRDGGSCSPKYLEDTRLEKTALMLNFMAMLYKWESSE